MAKTQPVHDYLRDTQHYQTGELGTLPEALRTLETSTKQVANVRANRVLYDSGTCESCSYWTRCGVTKGTCEEYIYEPGSLL